MSVNPSPNCKRLVDRITAAAPTLTGELAIYVRQWVAHLFNRLEAQDVPRDTKIFNDPIWGSILLRPPEILLLDTPLMQRLRVVRQLGMAHYVYLGAGYARLEHICGVVEGTQRIITALKTSSLNRAPGAPPVPIMTERDEEALRLAALLHDVGHAPFSHVTEQLIFKHFQEEFRSATSVVLEEFDDVLKVEPAELLSVMIVLSGGMLDILLHHRFPVSEHENLPLSIVGAILGSGKYISVPYLRHVVSGAIDADKLDYMARDSHHAGLAIALDTPRLLSQLQVGVVDEQNAPTPAIRDRAVAAETRRLYELCISRAGVGAYEQMIVGRAMLYDRVYYHHKVRTAEAMVRRLVDLSERASGAKFTLAQLMPPFSDEAFIYCVGGIVSYPEYPKASTVARRLADDILNRQLFYRAFAFAQRFVSGFDSKEPSIKNDTAILLGHDFLRFANDEILVKDVESEVACLAAKIAMNIGGAKYAEASSITCDDIIIDLPRPDRIGLGGQDIFVRTGSGDIEEPNLYFDPEKWSNAYEVKKLCGFIYARKEFVAAVNLAAKVVFAERFGAVMADNADRMTKTSKLHGVDIIERLLSQKLISADVAGRLSKPEKQFLRFRREDIEVPAAWGDQADTEGTVAEALAFARPRGYTSSEFVLIKQLLRGLSRFYDVSFQGGTFKTVEIGEEEKLRRALVDCLRSAGYTAQEEVAQNGGWADIIFEDKLVIETKILPRETDSPLAVAANAGWQARRYGIAVLQEIVATVVGFKPNSEIGLSAGRDMWDVRRLADEKTVEIRLCVPVGYPNPSSARAPRTRN